MNLSLAKAYLLIIMHITFNTLIITYNHTGVSTRTCTRVLAISEYSLLVLVLITFSVLVLVLEYFAFQSTQYLYS